MTTTQDTTFTRRAHAATVRGSAASGEKTGDPVADEADSVVHLTR